ncbi:LysR substrate-binding domain-containing protein (plasmid) [Roseobacteraceae bacterium NS-SX3]
MYSELPPLAWLRAFDASARLGNFTLAAEELGLTPSAVSYQVRGLEAQLGHKLFRRAHKVLELTPLGHAYLPVVSRAFSDIEATTSNLFGKKARAALTLRCLPSLNLMWLAPRIGRYQAAYPQISLRLLSAAWTEAAEDDAVDIDIRYGDGTWTDGEAIPLMQHDVVPVCAPGLRGDGSAAALAQGPLIEVAGVVDTWQHYFTRTAPGIQWPEAAFRVDQSLIALELAASGAGHALIAEVFARPYLDSGRLVRAAEPSLPTLQGHYLVVPAARNRHRPEVKSLINWLLAEAGADRDAGGGSGSRLVV